MKKIIVFFMTLVLIFTMTGCGKKPSAKIENEDIRRSSYKFNLTVDDLDIVTKGSVLVNFYKISKKDEVLVSTKTLTTFSESVSVTGLDSDTEYRCDVVCTYNKKSHIIYSWIVKTKKDGTEFDPIKITTANELVENITKDYSEDAYYELDADIDFTTYSNKDDEGNEIAFEGLSLTSSQAFAGTLKGNNHTIKNVNISSSASYNGFFGYFKGTLEDVKFEDISVTVNRDSSTTTYTGSVCGYAYQAKFINVEVVNSTLTVSAKTQYTGGVVGYSFATNLINCSNKNTNITSKALNGTTSYVGGLTSWIQQNSSDKYGKIMNATVEGTINISETKALYYGGLVALAKTGSTIERSIANINATISTYDKVEAGGLIGNVKMDDSKIADRIKNVVAKGNINYSTMKEDADVQIDGDVIIGGIIGSATGVKLSNAYSEMELVIKAQIKNSHNLYSSLVFGEGYDVHTTLSNAIVNGTINYDTTGSEDEVKPQFHGFDGSVYIDSEGYEKPMSIIDDATVKYVKIKINESEYAEYIAIKDAVSSANWNTAIWNVKDDGDKLIISFN